MTFTTSVSNTYKLLPKLVDGSYNIQEREVRGRTIKEISPAQSKIYYAATHILYYAKSTSFIMLNYELTNIRLCCSRRDIPEMHMINASATHP